MADHFFDTSAFALNAIGLFGNVGRNTMIGPGQANMDAAVMKIFQITERLRLQFRAEFFMGASDRGAIDLTCPNELDSPPRRLGVLGKNSIRAFKILPGR